LNTSFGQCVFNVQTEHIQVRRGLQQGPSPLSAPARTIGVVRYLITGGSGYIGSRLVDHLSGRPETDAIVVADVRQPASFRPKTTFAKLDVRDRQGVRELLEREKPDCLVHLAFLLNPIHDEAAMYDVDVNGTQTVLDAASVAGVEQVLVTSSTTAYGAFPDNPVPLTEDDPVRGAPDFSYARDKAEADRLSQLWALEHPDRVMTIVRPCIVFGPDVDNYIVRLWLRQPFRADFGLGDPPLQFVHVDDVADALILLVEGRKAGVFNVAADGFISVNEAADLLGLKGRRVPYGAFKLFAGALWKARASEAPAGQLEFVIHPWVASNAKLKEATGWSPRWTSREVFELTMRAKGKLAGAR
jgi:UDP-glucose 4-epimerase